ncbi:hypothetical protein LNP25_03585 [Klebsiella variicola subsp. variicola]|nr:hypothetical protein [Klebsiella variicola subsp. variicola]
MDSYIALTLFGLVLYSGLYWRTYLFFHRSCYRRLNAADVSLDIAVISRLLSAWRTDSITSRCWLSSSLSLPVP